MSKTTLDIVLPILNEEDSLQKQVCVISDFVKANLADRYDVKIIIADNGSNDRSPEIAAELCEQIDMVRYLRLDKRGVGLALKSAWGESQADIVGYMDLDLSTDINNLPIAVDILDEDGADVVTGSRLAPGAKVVGRKPVREVVSRTFNMIVKLYFNTHFSDGMCGFKFLKRQHLKQVMDMGAVSDGWFFATEVLVCSEYAGLRVHDIPVTWIDDPNSKAKIGKLTIEYLQAMRVLKQRLKAC